MRKIIAASSAVVLAAVLMGAAAPPGDGQSVAEYLKQHPETQVVEGAALNLPSVAVVGGSGQIMQTLRTSKTSVSFTQSTQAQSLAAAGCSYGNAAFINYSGWQQSVDGCGILGWDSTARWYYTWQRDIFAWNSGGSCVQGRGYYTSPSISTPLWFNAGCGGGGNASAHIGNRLTVAKIRGYAIAPPTIGYVRWK